jgi:hypothetical protein
MMRNSVSGLSGLRPGCVRVQVDDFARESGCPGYFSKINIERIALVSVGPTRSHIRNRAKNPDNPDNPDSPIENKGLSCPGYSLAPGQPGHAAYQCRNCGLGCYHI